MGSLRRHQIERLHSQSNFKCSLSLCFVLRNLMLTEALGKFKLLNKQWFPDQLASLARGEGVPVQTGLLRYITDLICDLPEDVMSVTLLVKDCVPYSLVHKLVADWS